MDVQRPATLYWFDGAIVIAKRRKVDALNYPDFVRMCVGGARPTVHVYAAERREGAGPLHSGEARSPNEIPVAQAARDERPSDSGTGTGGRSSGRDTSKQEEFRLALLRRDSNVCVLCAEERPSLELEAAHILPLRASADEMRTCGLANTFSVQNGIMLCGVCHEFFDRHLWYVNKDGVVVVADALLHDKDGAFKLHWSARNGRQLVQPKELKALWPAPAVWAYRELKFLEVQKVRWDAALLFICSKCGKGCKTLSGLAAHVLSKACERAATLTRRYVAATPVKNRSRGGAVLGDRGRGRRGRRSGAANAK